MKIHLPIAFLSLLCLTTCVKSQPVTAVSNPVYINFNMPELVLDSDIFVNDPNNNNTLDANERIQVSFFIRNKGNYVANRVEIRTHVSEGNSGIQGSGNEKLGNMDKGERKLVKKLIHGGPDLKTGQIQVDFQIVENDSLATTISHTLNTFSIAKKPRLEIIAHDFFSLGGAKVIKPNSEFELRIRLKNTGSATAKDVRFEINHNKHIVILSDLSKMLIQELPANEVKELSFRFFMGPNYKESKIPLRVRVYDINEGSGEIQKLSEPINHNE